MTAAALPYSLAPRVAALPAEIRAHLGKLWQSIAGAKPRRSADKWQIIERWQRESRADFEVRAELRAFAAREWRVSDDEISAVAFRVAHLHAREQRLGRAVISPNLDRSIFPPLDDDALARRLACPRFWARALRTFSTRTVEHGLRSRGFVRKGQAPYVSDHSAALWSTRRKRSRRMLEASIAVSDAGDQLPLIDVVESTQSNPRLRRGELMTRARGFEEHAKASGDVALFVTLTTPSRFHPQRSAGGENPKYDGSSPRDAQAWLCKMWQRARAKLARLSIEFYGIRVAEPHHDGTPHWHLLMFFAPHHRTAVDMVLAGYWLSDDGDEPGAAEHRVTFVDVDMTGERSAAGYLAKYVAKNIDGHKVGDDHEAEAPSETAAERVRAWASTWGIRQFQQVGGPPVGLWRELRRLREPVKQCADIESARGAADSGDYAGFIAALAAAPVWLEKGPPRVPFNRYGEPRAPEVVGVRSAAALVRTRVKRWVILFGDALASLVSSLGPVSITVRGPGPLFAAAGGFAPAAAPVFRAREGPS